MAQSRRRRAHTPLIKGSPPTLPLNSSRPPGFLLRPQQAGSKGWWEEHGAGSRGPGLQPAGALRGELPSCLPGPRCHLQEPGGQGLREAAFVSHPTHCCWDATWGSQAGRWRCLYILHPRQLLDAGSELHLASTLSEARSLSRGKASKGGKHSKWDGRRRSQHPRVTLTTTAQAAPESAHATQGGQDGFKKASNLSPPFIQPSFLASGET